MEYCFRTPKLFLFNHPIKSENFNLNFGYIEPNTLRYSSINLHNFLEWITIFEEVHEYFALLELLCYFEAKHDLAWFMRVILTHYVH